MGDRKIVFITKDISASENSDGTSIILHNLLNRLNNFNVEIIYFGIINIDAEKHFAKHNIRVLHQKLFSNKFLFFENIGGLFFLKPFNVIRICFSRFSVKLIKKSDYYCFLGFESGFLIPLFGEKGKDKIVYFEIDSLSLYYSRSIANSTKIISKLYNRLQLLLIQNSENIFYNLSSRILFISNVDKAFAIHKFSDISSRKFFNLRLGIDDSNNLWDSKKVRKNFNIVFTGNLDYKPNFEAASFIVKNILPEFSVLGLNIKFHIVGQCSKNLKVELGIKDTDNVVFSGFVDDLNSYLAEMDIFISPLFIGSGMKNKILKSMSIGIPIVCTSLSIDGIDEMENGVNCLICDSHSGKIWKEQLLGLLANDKLKQKFSENTISIAKTNYNWNYIVNDFLKLIY